MATETLPELPALCLDECRNCGAPIRWAITSKGKRMPMDLEPVLGGNRTCEFIPASQDHRGRKTPMYFITESLKPNPQVMAYVAHFASCPNRQDRR